MALVHNQYGKGRVRVMRVNKTDAQTTVSELTVKAIIRGDFAPAYVKADNSTSVSTDTVKNVCNVVAHEFLDLETEKYCEAVADRLLKYSQVEMATVSARETKWTRLVIDGKPSPIGFTLDANGKPSAEVVKTRDKVTVVSGIDGFTFLKTTESGWDKFAKDPYTTIKETRDRMAATAMDATWTWIKTPDNYAAKNKLLLETMLKVFATTYSASVQDSLYRMGTAGLAAVPEIGEISMACPNKHYILMDLSPFGITNKNQVFLPTDEPHGQIECTVGRG